MAREQAYPTGRATVYEVIEQYSNWEIRQGEKRKIHAATFWDADLAADFAKILTNKRTEEYIGKVRDRNIVIQEDMAYYDLSEEPVSIDFIADSVVEGAQLYLMGLATQNKRVRHDIPSGVLNAALIVPSD